MTGKVFHAKMSQWLSPWNRLEALKGGRSDQHNIRINDQWRICFRWESGAQAVEIVDYH
jgi:proteic killer suppression protein